MKKLLVFLSILFVCVSCGRNLKNTKKYILNEDTYKTTLNWNKNIIKSWGAYPVNTNYIFYVNNFEVFVYNCDLGMLLVVEYNILKYKQIFSETKYQEFVIKFYDRGDIPIDTVFVHIEIDKKRIKGNKYFYIGGLYEFSQLAKIKVTQNKSIWR